VNLALLALRLDALAQALAHPSEPSEGAWSSRPTEAAALANIANEVRAEALTATEGSYPA
jgi:hypothetical protein